MVVCVPSEVTGVERRALGDAATRCAARRLYVIEEPIAAAIGAGLSVNDTKAAMVVDVGGGTTDVAVISLGGIVSARSMRIGGDEVDEALIAHVKSEYSPPAR
jgi:rod shape-determining protein MreB